GGVTSPGDAVAPAQTIPTRVSSYTSKLSRSSPTLLLRFARVRAAAGDPLPVSAPAQFRRLPDHGSKLGWRARCVEFDSRDAHHCGRCECRAGSYFATL